MFGSGAARRGPPGVALVGDMTPGAADVEAGAGNGLVFNGGREGGGILEAAPFAAVLEPGPCVPGATPGISAMVMD